MPTSVLDQKIALAILIQSHIVTLTEMYQNCDPDLAPIIADCIDSQIDILKKLSERPKTILKLIKE